MTAPGDRSAQTGPYIQTAAQGDCISLQVGQPSVSLLPIEVLHRTATMTFGPGRDRSLLQYGAAAGYPAFREHLAAFLSAQLGRRIDPDTLVVTGGISQALAMVSQVLAAPGAQVVCEDPTYFLARRIFEEHRLDVRGVPVDGHGLRIDILEDRLRAGELRPAFVYCIPSFHNPTGTCLAAERAARLLALAAEFDFTVLSDNPYCLLSFTGQPPAVFAAGEHGRNSRLLELGSFSKILAPGLRLGWIEAAPALRQRVLDHGTLRSGGGINPIVSAMVEPALCGSDGEEAFLVTHLQTLRSTYAERARSLADSLHRLVPEAAFAVPSGGYYLWLDLGDSFDGLAFLETARQHGVSYLPGERCSIATNLSRFVRLSFSFYRADELQLAAERLGRALHGGRAAAR